MSEVFLKFESVSAADQKIDFCFNSFKIYAVLQPYATAFLLLPPLRSQGEKVAKEKMCRLVTIGRVDFGPLNRGAERYIYRGSPAVAMARGAGA